MVFSKGAFSDLVSAAELVGLEPAQERHKYACPVHGGSDSLHAYQGAGSGFYCWGVLRGPNDRRRYQPPINQRCPTPTWSARQASLKKRYVKLDKDPPESLFLGRL